MARCGVERESRRHAAFQAMATVYIARSALNAAVAVRDHQAAADRAANEEPGMEAAARSPLSRQQQWRRPFLNPGTAVAEAAAG